MKTLITFTLVFCMVVTCAYSAEVPAGAVAFFPFEGSADDMSGNGFHGTIHGDVYFAEGHLDLAACFDGDHDCIDMGGALNLTTGMSIRFWKLELRLAYAHFFYPTREVDEGKIQHIQGFGDEGNVINAGTYDASIDILTAGILARF